MVSKTTRTQNTITLCALGVCMLFFGTALAQDEPPVLVSATELGDGKVRLYWANDDHSFHRTSLDGFAYDFYADAWQNVVSGAVVVGHDRYGDPIYYEHSAYFTHSGGYAAWVYEWNDSGEIAYSNPLCFIVYDTRPRQPAIRASDDIGSQTIRVQFKPDIYGTWLYWVGIADALTGELFDTDGDLGNRPWHYLDYQTEDYMNGTIELTVPWGGTYLVLLVGLAWDGETLGHFVFVEVEVSGPPPTPRPIPAGDYTIYLPGDVPLELMLIPAGSFQMGSPESEPDRWPIEGPVHTVNITQDFYMGKYEVTQRQWAAVMGSSLARLRELYGMGESYPVYFVSWGHCQDFLTALNTHITNTGQGPVTLGLPTEAQWEYACRAGTQTAYYWGDSWSDEYGWGQEGEDITGSREVGRKLPNNFGLHDMSGSLWEWCQDRWGSDYYSSSPTNDPQGPSSDILYNEIRLLRGGSWSSHLWRCRSAARDGWSSWYSEHDTGFRVAGALPTPTPTPTITAP